MTFEEIVRKSQAELKQALIGELRRMGYKTSTQKGFTYAKGSVPVLLVAHLDTVHKQPVKHICYSQNGRIVMSPEGIGGDDRAGVYMILEIIRKHRCHVLFCEDEEIGCRGASAFADGKIKPEVDYIVELDRRGSNDAVFYECDNRDFVDFVTGFGFDEEFGSFSDISIIAPSLGVAAVNISAGYYNEHTRYEHVDMDAVETNIERIGKMVATKAQKYEYIEAVYVPRYLAGGRGYYRGIDDWELDRWHAEKALRGYGKDDECGTKNLMLIPESAYIKTPKGEYVECDGQYFIDINGAMYEHVSELGVAVIASGFDCCTEHGTPVRYNEKDAFEMDVMPLEEALEELALYELEEDAPYELGEGYMQ